MGHYKHRLLIAAVKVAAFLAWLWGVPDPLIAAVVTPWALWRAYVTLRDGHVEQYVEPFTEGVSRRWEDLVWDNTRWVNRETPEEGIVRLTARPLAARATSLGEPKPVARLLTERAPHLLPIP